MSTPVGALRFRPRLWPSLATLAGLTVLVTLGTWQVERLRWKEDLMAARERQLAASPVPLPADGAWPGWDFRQVEVRGAFAHDLEQLYGAMTHQGQLGHHVLTPLVRDDGAALLVDRGWVPSDRAHPAARREGQIEGPVAVTGIARYRGDDRAGWFTPANQPEQGLWYHYDLPALEQALGLNLLPVVLEADATSNPGGLPVGGLTRITLANNHLQYAVTWYGLALTLVAVYLAFSLRRGGNE
ncbi:MAG: SURF1 family protein [Pseudomonadota bacterium]